jgi:CHAT domain-containing protein
VCSSRRLDPETTRKDKSLPASPRVTAFDLPALRARVLWTCAALALLAACHRQPEAGSGDDLSAVDTPAANAASDPVTLAPEPGTVRARPLRASEAHRYMLPVEGGHIVELSIEQRGVNVELAAFTGSGQPALRVNRALGSAGVEHAALLSVTGTTYVLDVIALETSGADSGYRLSVDSLRPANSADEARAAAEASFATAEHLAESLEKESCRNAVPRYVEALEGVRSLEDRSREAEVLQQLGWVHRKCLEEKRTALHYYSAALEILEERPESRRKSSILNNIGRMHHELGEMEQAVASWRRALPLKRELDDRLGEASTLSNLGMASRYLGDLHEALTFYDQSLDVLRAAGARRLEGRALNNRGRLYDTLGMPDQALVDLEGAAALAEEIDDRPLQAAALTGMGRILVRRGEPARALETLERARELRVEVGSDHGRAVTMVALAAAHEQVGHRPRALELNRQALALFTDLEAPRNEAVTLGAIARLSEASDTSSETATMLARALALFQQVRDVHGEIETLFALAAAERERDQPRQALAWIETALESLESVRSRAATFDLSSRYLAQRQGHYDTYVDVLMDLHRAHPDAGYDGEALVANEKSRARALVDLLATNRDLLRRDVPAEVLTRERETRQRVVALERLRLEMLESPSAAGKTAEVEARLDEALRDFRSIQARIRGQSARYARWVEPAILDVEQIQQTILDDDTLLLEYRLGPTRSHLWAVSSRSLETFELPKRSEVESLARRVYGLLQESHRRELRSQTALALEELGALLLGPVAGELARYRRLLIVTDGALQYVPMGALPIGPAQASSHDHSETRPLIQALEIVMLPSASMLAVLRGVVAGRPPPPQLVAVLADPVFDSADSRLAAVTAGARPGEGSGEPPPAEELPTLRRLIHSGREAQAILELAGADRSFQALGFDATREAALSPELARYRILHLATHGELVVERPELSRLVFSTFDARGRPREGAVYAHEVFELNLRAELVVLSACETALGTEVRGEGLVGLAHAFLQAGAERVLVGAWRVDDRATAELMLRFYRHLLVDEHRPAEALRRAQMSVAATPGWQAPYYWAGFVLQGEWR